MGHFSSVTFHCFLKVLISGDGKLTPGIEILLNGIRMSFRVKNIRIKKLNVLPITALWQTVKCSVYLLIVY